MYSAVGNDVNWEAIVRLTERLSSAPDLLVLREMLSIAAQELVDADGLNLVLRRGDFCYYLIEDTLRGPWKGMRLPLSDSIVSGWCILHDRVAIIEDMSRDRRITDSIYDDTKVKRLIKVPIGAPAPFAALGVYWSSSGVLDKRVSATVVALAKAACSAVQALEAGRSRTQAIDENCRLNELLGIGRWSLSLDHNELEISLVTRLIFSLHPGAQFTFADFIESFHSTERFRITEAIKTCVEKGEALDLVCKLADRCQPVTTVRVICDIVEESVGVPRHLNGAIQICDSK